MKFKQFLVSTALVAMAVCGANAQQPYGGCWHPDDIKNWSPETDPDAKFNRSRVPLAQRFKEPELMKANANQFYEGQVCNATILFNMCSLCPSQGANNFLGYQPTYWQYMDKLVYWAGSASEGIIIPPPAGSIDAAHAQGVKVLGQIFFPPTAFGGTQAWVRQMVTQENGKYIYAIKLYEIAKYLGFDGWFINEETGGASSKDWVGFIKEFNAIADANGDTQMEIQWYNASGTPNVSILNSHKNTSQFLEYGNVKSYLDYAEDLGGTDAVFSKIYAGIQCVDNGLNGWNRYLNSAFPTTGHVGSVDLFCPEERIWKDNVRNILGSSDDNGPKAYEATAKTFANEEKVWVNNSGDPTAINANWRGLSGAILERSVITSVPFISDMNVGVGKHRFVKGQIMGTQDWYHSGMQSILPTWRWWIENRGSIKVDIDWDNAYSSASSFKFTGITAGSHLVRLYKTMIDVTGSLVAEVAYKGNAAPALCISTSSSVTPDVTLNAVSTSNDNSWSVAKYDLSSLNGKTIYMLALDLNNVGETFNLGRLSITSENYHPTALNVTNAKIEARLGEESGDIRLSWDYDWSTDFDHFDIYTVDSSKKKTLVGQTRGEGFYLPKVIRNGIDPILTIELTPVMKDGGTLTPTVLTAEYPKASAPTVIFKPSPSYIKIGETAKLAVVATGAPDVFQWTLPEGLELVEGNLNDAEITVKGVKEGRHEVSLKVANNIGSSNVAANVIDVLNEGDYNSIKNVALHKTIVSYSGSTNKRESPDNLLDGDTNPYSVSKKWCNIAPESWCIIDCEGLYRFYQFKIYDCKAGPESNENFKDYTIEISDDMENWTTVVDEKDRDRDNIKVDYIAPVAGRYIRFSPKVDGTLRVWEFEAYGVDDIHYTINIDKPELKLNAGENAELKLSYNLNGDTRADDFYCDVETLNESVKIGEITENEAAQTFIIPVTAEKMIAENRLIVRLHNGATYRETYVNVTIDSDNAENILSGRTANLRSYQNDYSYEAPYTEYNVSTLTDGDTQSEALESVENPSSHKDDFWAIFKADDIWNLSKVRIHLVNGNKGENDNGKEGYVNNEISIAIGDDIDNLQRVKTFSNLEDVAMLQYIFPEYAKTKYIAVICNLNPYFYPSLAEIEAYEQLEGVVPQLSAVEVNGWNADIIAESEPVNQYVTEHIGSGWNFFTTEIYDEGALTDTNRKVSTNTDHSYTLAPLDQPNALVIKESGKSYDLTFTERNNCKQLHILTVSPGDTNVDVTVNYEDGSQSEKQSIQLSDWYYGEENECAVNGLDRVWADAENTDDYEVGEFGYWPAYKLFEATVKADPSKVVKGLSFVSNQDDVKPIILALLIDKATSGIDAINIDDSTKVIEGIYNMQGLKVNNPECGLYIIRYSDGSAKKIIIR